MPAKTHGKRNPAANAQEGRAGNQEIRLLRQRLAMLARQEQHIQIENVMLHRQLQSFQAQQQKADRARKQAANTNRSASLQARRVLLEEKLSALMQRRALLQTELESVQAAYRAGLTPIKPVAEIQAEADQNDRQIQYANRLLRDLQAGHPPSQTEQERRTLEQKQEELQSKVILKTEELRLLNARYRAGTVTKVEVTDAEQQLAGVQAEIAEVKQRLLQLKSNSDNGAR